MILPSEQTASQKGRPAIFDEALIDRLGRLRLDHDKVLDERQQSLTACLEKLPSEQKAILEQCYGNDRSIKALASACG